MPVTIANSNVGVTHIFSNFYRLAIYENMKGVFVVQGENSAYLILEVIDAVSGAHVHSLFMLEKKTGADTVTMSSLQNTSWDISGAGAMYNTALGTQSVTMEDGVLSIYEASDTLVNQKINGVLKAGTYTMPLEDRPVIFTLQDIGYNTWSGSAEYNPAVIYTMLNNNSGVLSIVTNVENNTTLSFIGMIRRR